MSCIACTCHKCLGHAAEFEKLKREVAQVAKLQESVNQLKVAGRNLADEVANLQILCRVRGTEHPETIEYPDATSSKRPRLLD